MKGVLSGQVIYYKAKIEKQMQPKEALWKLKEERNKLYLQVLKGIENGKFGTMINRYLMGKETDEIFENPEYLRWATVLERLMLLENMLISMQIGKERVI